MLVAKEEQDFISNSSAENYRALLAKISKLVNDSAEKAADQQLREIKKFRRKEPKLFKRKGNEIQHKFNEELPWTKRRHTLKRKQLRKPRIRYQKVRYCA